MYNNTYHVYILTRERNSVFYVGITNNLFKRIMQHKNEDFSGFTKKHNVKKLVYFETHGEIIEAIRREKIIKKWKRIYKIRAIESMNPEWRDLYEDFCE